MYNVCRLCELCVWQCLFFHPAVHEVDPIEGRLIKFLTLFADPIGTAPLFISSGAARPAHLSRPGPARRGVRVPVRGQAVQPVSASAAGVP